MESSRGCPVGGVQVTGNINVAHTVVFQRMGRSEVMHVHIYVCSCSGHYSAAAI